jgi:hypothetical protein
VADVDVILDVAVQEGILHTLTSSVVKLVEAKSVLDQERAAEADPGKGTARQKLKRKIIGVMSVDFFMNTVC